MRKRNLLALLAIIVIAGIFYFSLVAAPDNDGEKQPAAQAPVVDRPVFDYKACQYLIDGQLITDAKYFGNEVTADFNADGRPDTASIISQNSDGSGVFYYLVIAFRQEDDTCLGSNAIFLGDRIAPQTTEYINGQLIVNFADRKPGEAMTAQPSMGISRYFKIEANTLVEIDPASSTMTENYNNQEYGFSLFLPPSWRKYSVVNEKWNGQLLIAPYTKFSGPKIIIRNPNWTEAEHWQDIPIMVFSHEEWKLISDENLSVGAAPIGPSRLGENGKYVFALPARWLGFTDDLGQDQATEIIKTFKIITY